MSEERQKTCGTDEPMKVAGLFRRDAFPTPGQGAGLWWRGGDYWCWLKGRWVLRGQDEMRRELWRWLEDLWCGDETEREKYCPDRYKVENVLDALESLSEAPFAVTPCWTCKAPRPNPLTCIGFRDRVVSVAGGALDLFERDESWMDLALVDVDYDPTAECPRWLRCLEEWGEGDPQWGVVLRRMMGYALMGKRAYAKWFLLQGKSRGGKGVICQVLRRLVGDEGWFASSMDDMSGNFGLDGIQNARVLAINEVSQTHEDGRQRVAQVLKGILGEDEMTVNVKYQRAIRNVRARTVPILSGNMIPVLPNEAEGLSGKMVVIPFTRTFLGHEQFNLLEELESELPGIAAWAVIGARAVEEMGGRCWEECQAARDVRMQFRVENNPFEAFLEARCVQDPAGFVPTEMLWDSFQDFMAVNQIRGHHVPRNYFVNRLMAGTTWNLSKGRHKVTPTSDYVRVLKGLRLRKVTEDEL